MTYVSQYCELQPKQIKHKYHTSIIIHIKLIVKPVILTAYLLQICRESHILFFNNLTIIFKFKKLFAAFYPMNISNNKSEKVINLFSQN